VVCGPGLDYKGIPSQRIEDRICVFRTTESLAIANWAGRRNGAGGSRGGFNQGGGLTK
jgi:hypothetical protein